MQDTKDILSVQKEHMQTYHLYPQNEPYLEDL